MYIYIIYSFPLVFFCKMGGGGGGEEKEIKIVLTCAQYIFNSSQLITLIIPRCDHKFDYGYIYRNPTTSAGRSRLDRCIAFEGHAEDHP